MFLFLQFNSCRKWDKQNSNLICLQSTGLGAPPPFLFLSSGEVHREYRLLYQSLQLGARARWGGEHVAPGWAERERRGMDETGECYEKQLKSGCENNRVTLKAAASQTLWLMARSCHQAASAKLCSPTVLVNNAGECMTLCRRVGCLYAAAPHDLS